MFSDWIEASKLDLTYFSEWKTSRTDSKKATLEEKIAWGVFNFMCRAILTPMKDPRFCLLFIVAIPVKKSDFKGMNGHEIAKMCGSFHI